MATVPLRAGELTVSHPARHSAWRLRVGTVVALLSGFGAFLLGGALFGRSDDDTGQSAVAPIVETLELPADHELTGSAASRFCILLLEQAERRLSGVTDLRATFHKRERVDGALTDLNIMDLKVRRTPLSVYMRWREPYAGREIIWQEDANDGQILVHAGGWQKKIVPLLRIDPLGERAMEYNRRPVSQIGLWNFNRRLLESVRVGLERPDLRIAMTQDKKIGGRATYCFRFLHEDWVDRAPYHKSLIYVDQELGIPIACELYGWPERESDEPPLEESYAFTDLELDVGLSDIDFDITNPDYEFRARRKRAED